MTKHVLIIVALLTVCPIAAHAQTDFASLDQFLKSFVSNEAHLDMKAEGDLNGDGLADWAGLIRREKPDQPQTYQLYVLLKQPQGGYRVAETTKEEQIAGMGCCWVEDLQIQRASIYVQSNAKTADTMEAATHQFKLYKGEWRLVGLRVYYIEHSADTTTETDMNVLTGAVIEKRQKGERKPTVVRKRSKKFGVAFLKDFDFSNMFGAE